MLEANKKHVIKVLKISLAIALPGAAASLLVYPPLIAASILTGAALSFFNIVSIVQLTEILAGAALQVGVSKGVKAFATLVHVFKLGLIFAVLVALVVFKLTDLFALLAGFTVVLLVNLFSGLSGLAKGPGANGGAAGQG